MCRGGKVYGACAECGAGITCRDFVPLCRECWEAAYVVDDEDDS